jgi:hypothetical protein
MVDSKFLVSKIILALFGTMSIACGLLLLTLKKKKYKNRSTTTIKLEIRPINNF